jgi:hypothetical protein
LKFAAGRAERPEARRFKDLDLSLEQTECTVRRPFKLKMYADAQDARKEILITELLKTNDLTVRQTSDAPPTESLGCRTEGLLLHCAPCATPGFALKSR